jgi:ATP-dependent RNA helicase RhlE
MNFGDFGLAEPIVRAISKEGYSVATPIQAQSIPVVLEGHDVIGIAQTGTGKTAAFALPIIHQLVTSKTRRDAGVRPVQVLILASTRELAIQIHESFKNYGAFASIRATTIYGGVGQQPQVRALRQGVDVVVATPGRLMDLIQQKLISLADVHTLVLDEADRMLDMGFFPAIRRILKYVPTKRQTLMFSATMKPEIRELAGSILHNPVSISIEPKQKTTELVDQSVCFVPQKQKTRLLIELITRANPARAIVFSRTKHGADRIVRHMVAAGFQAEAIHANKSQNKRQRILEQFKSTAPPILVATDIAARGIDVDGVSHVFIHDMPTEEETYVHRIGRSGRAGATGVSIALCDPDERRMLRSIEKLIGMSIPVQEVEGFDFSAALDSTDVERPDRPQRRGRQGSPLSPNAAGRGRSRDGQERRPPTGGREVARSSDNYSVHRRFEKPARTEPGRDGGRSAERRGSAGSGGQGRGNTVGRRDDGAVSRRPEGSVPRSQSAQSRPQGSSRPVNNARPSSEPRTARPRPSQSDDFFGDGLFVEGSAEKSGSEQGPARRRRKRPTRTNT